MTMTKAEKIRDAIARCAADNKSPRHLAWRNMMVAAVNAGLDQKRFGLDPGDNRWPGAAPSMPPHGPGSEGHALFRFTFGDDIPAIAYAYAITGQELRIHVALWPTPDAENWMAGQYRANFDCGDAFALGYVERLTGKWLQSSTPGGETFSCRRDLAERIAAVKIEPQGFADHGKFFL